MKSAGTSSASRKRAQLPACGTVLWLPPKVPRTAELAADVRGIYSGQYMARVRAVSALNVSSVPTTSVLTNLEGKTGAPPALASLTATSMLFAIGLAWTFPPGAEDTQRTEIWYGPANDLAAATKLSDLAYPQSDYVLQIPAAGAQYFFWGRLVDRTGNIGPFYPAVNGVVGQVSSDADPILDLILDKLTKDQFGQDLRDEIDGKATQEYVDEVVSGLQEQIGDIVSSGVYVPTDAYETNNTVRVGDNLWTAIANVPAAPDGSNGPPNAAYWVNSGQVVTAANGLAAQVQQNTASIEEQGDAITAQAQRLSGVESELDEKASASALNNLSSTVARNGDDISAQGQAIASVTSRLSDVEDENDAQAGALTSLGSTVNQQSDQISLNATRIDGVYAQVKPRMAGDTTHYAGGTDSYVGVYSVLTAVIEGDYAQGLRSETIEVRLASATAAIQVNQQATITAQQTAEGVKALADLSYQVKLQANANGTYAWAGYGIGLTNASGIFQSQFVIAADQFIIATTQGADYRNSPFAVVGNQAFLKEAFIQKATIQNLLVGVRLTSVAVNAQGQPYIDIDFNSGAFYLRGSGARGRSEFSPGSILMFDTNNVLRIRQSVN